jgi:AbrB family looped-hinge helix DNA binding protein
MPVKTSANPVQEIEAKVTAKGQVTLPKALRSHLGIHQGSRIRFRLHPQGGFQADQVLLDLKDHWKMADQMARNGAKPKRGMTFKEMNEAKARRVW